MNPQDIKKQKAALREAMKARRKLVRQQMAQNPLYVRARRRRLWVRVVLLVILLALLLLIRCDCGTPGDPAPAPVAVKLPPPVKPPPIVQKKVPAKNKPVKRPDFGKNEMGLLKWIEILRMQAAARNERMAECFAGTDKPGAIRWIFSLNSDTGRVSDHSMEPVGEGATLSTEQQTCLIEVLRSPNFNLGDPPKEGIPPRLSLVLEF